MIRDRLSFRGFLEFGLEDAVPDATTIWLFREAIVDAGLIDKLFDRFGQHGKPKPEQTRYSSKPKEIKEMRTTILNRPDVYRAGSLERSSRIWRSESALGSATDFRKKSSSSFI